MKNQNARIARLRDLDDFEVADNDPDVRGWNVLSADGRNIGKVEDLYVDPAAMRVRYLDVELDKEFRRGGNERHIIVPVENTKLQDKGDKVIVAGLEAARVNTVPTYGGRMDNAYEDSVRTHFGATRGTSPTGGDRQTEERLTLSEEQLRVERERQQAGEVRVGKHVETEHVSRDVPVTREEVTIERQPASGMTAKGARIENDEVRVPVYEEEVTVEKRTVPKEELVVKKHKVQDTEHVETDLRREQADIDEKASTRSPKRGR